MPPKQKGQNLRGRDKLFRHAVEHVHVGVGHTVIGDLSLHLAAGRSARVVSTPTVAADPSAALLEDRPAFYLELNEQLLSHSSKDFKKFRYETLELCETRALMDVSHRRIAEKLLMCLLDRSGGTVSNRAKSKATKTVEGKGETGEGFAAFVRLTIAFARDMGPKFFQYFEVFHQAVHAGLFDRRGSLLPDTARLQLVFSAQVAWCREMSPYWCVPEHRRLVERALGLYVSLLSDSRDFVRRLAAELLAYTCRLARPLLPLVVEMMSGGVLDDFQRYAAKMAQSQTHEKRRVGLDDDDDADLLDLDDKEEEEGQNEAEQQEAASETDGGALPVSQQDADGSGVSSSLVLTPAQMWTVPRTAQYAKEILPDHPVTDGFGLFAAELMRGIRGALSSSFEYFFLSLLERGLLLSAAEKKVVLAEDEVFMAAFGYETLEADAPTDDVSGPLSAATREMAMHASRYNRVFAVVDSADSTASRDAAALTTPEAFPCDDALEPVAVPLAQEMVRQLTTLAMQAALQAVLREVRANSSRRAYSESDASASDDDEEEGEDAHHVSGHDDADGAHVAGHQRATTRLLHAVVAPLQPQCVHHIHLLSALLSSSYYYLWQDARELSVLRRLAEKLHVSLKAHASFTVSTTTVYGAVLQLVMPLCLTPYLCNPLALRAGVAEAAAAHANDSHTVAIQKVFLPVGREVVQQLLRLAASPTAAAESAEMEEVVESARVTLYAFAQDILQKQFAFCIAEERRAAEEGGDLAAATAATSRAGHNHNNGEHGDDDDAESYEDAYVPDDHEEDGALGSFTSAKRMEAQRRQLAEKRARQAQSAHAKRAESVLAIKSLLTPFALTLLHALCSGYWAIANTALAAQLSAMGHDKKTPQSTASAAAWRDARHVERAVLLVRLVHDRTRHVTSSPLQQLLRLKAQSHKASAAVVAGVALRQCLETMLTRLMQLFVHRAEQVLAADRASLGPTPPVHADENNSRSSVIAARLAAAFENEMELLACCVPVLRDLFAVSAAPEVAAAAAASDDTSVTSAAPHALEGLRAPLERVLDVVRRWMDSTAVSNKNKTDGAPRAAVGAVSSLVSPSSGYALYAQVASVLIHGAADRADEAHTATKQPQLRSKTSMKQKKTRAVAPGAAVFDHLAETIQRLASAFEASKPSSSSASPSSSSTSTPAYAASTVERVLSESERGQLLYATQVLLRSLLWCLGLPEDAHTAGKRLSEATRHALRTLSQSLSKTCQAQLVHAILLESLVSPMQSLRLLTLRLLVWLCHADLPEEDRLVGLSRVDTELLLALVRAEEFNPLSAVGNLDGLKQVLAKVTFAVEAGSLTDPLERSLLARAMMGLYYLKFSGAWPLATRILHGLVRVEQTTPDSVFAQHGKNNHTNDDDDEDEDAMSERGGDADEDTLADGRRASAVEDDGNSSHAVAKKSTRRRRLEPIVWSTVIVPYAHLMVFGDVIARDSAEDRVEQIEDEDDADAHADGADEDKAEKEKEDEANRHARCEAFATYRCPYTITLTDQQRHEKGAMVSRAFSSTQYTDDVVAVVDLAGDDGEVISWRQHWVGHLYRATTSSFFARSTDRVTLAQTFLGALEEMMKHSSALDSKLRLVEGLVMELTAIDRNEHPAGVTQLRKLDERLCLAMRACAIAPTTVLSAGQQQRVAHDALTALQARNTALEQLFASYTAHSSAKLQRAALDNLKRLKVEPFLSHHAQLTPYCDSMKGLFGFLSSFHLDTIPVHARGDYVSTAIAVCLPKLIGKVSKDRRRDQAVLQRRLMGFLAELASDQKMTAPAAAVGAKGGSDVVTHVLDRVTQRLVLSRVSTSDELTDVRAFDFLAQWTSAVQDATDRHAVRHLERQCRQLTHATRLLQSLIGAVGQHFASYVRSCLHLALQAYLVACRQNLRDVLAQRTASAKREQEEEGSSSAEQQLRITRWCEEAERALRGRRLSLALAELRRTAVTVVAQLLEQFPTESISVIEQMVGATNTTAAAPVDAVHQSLFGRYLTALYTNSKGVTQQSPDAPGARSVGAVKSASRSTVTPMLRLLVAWVTRQPLLPLVVAFGEEVTGTFAELFAVNPLYLEASRVTTRRQGGLPSVHKAPATAVYDALRCLTDLLARRDETVPVLGTLRKQKHAVTTLQDAFLASHVTPIFTSVYKLIMHGEEERDSSATDTKNAAASSPSTVSGRFSVMAFSVPMWKEVIRTVSMLAQQMGPEGEESTGGATTATTRAGAVAAGSAAMQDMLGRLLEVSLRFVVHPICVTDVGTVVMAVQVVRQLLGQLAQVDLVRHYRPLVHLFNTVTNPEARLLLCETVKRAVPKIHLTSVAGSRVAGGDAAEAVSDEVSAALEAQMAAAARAVACLNSFDDNNTSLDRYDFDLRYHTFHSLQQFFSNNGNYGALQGETSAGGKTARGGDATVRRERDYSGELDVRLPVAKQAVPVLAIPVFQLLAANIMYFLRDPEATLRAQAVQLFYAMMRYATAAQQQSLYPAGYATLVLEQVVRQGEVLSTLRHGVVARDVHIRNDHMTCFGALGRYFETSFPSFRTLYSPNTGQDFFQNVGHVQHKCRLHALTLLRKLGPELQLRDVLRVFVPFLMSAVKDFAQGKRDMQNTTEGRAKGYCDAVLITIAALTEKMPWEAYYRVLTLFLSNAGANASLRMPMLRGVVQVLENFHFLDAEGEDAAQQQAAPSTTTTTTTPAVNEEAKSSDDDDDVQDDDEAVRADVARRRRQFRHQHILSVLEQDILPQLFGFIGSDKEGQKTLGLTGELKGSNINTVSSVRKEQEAEDKATTKNAILQLPVALAVTRIVKHFPEGRFNFYVDHLMDELVKKLRTKNDRHRDSARRILGAMLQETGPSKLRPIITKLQDNLVHGYQLHVLGYTVVTLLFQLYEPQSATASGGRHRAGGGADAASRGNRHHADPVAEVLDDAKKRKLEQQSSKKKKKQKSAGGNDSEEEDDDDDEDDVEATNATRRAAAAAAAQAGMTEEEKADAAVAVAEQDLIDQLMPHATAFDHDYGVFCLTNLLDQLITIFLDDYLGEVSAQKEQVELMSKMVEIKSSRAAQGFAFLARHAEASRMMEVFLQKIAWVLTPPSDTSVDVDSLHGSAKVRALMMHELRTKYVTVSKKAGADLGFVNKVRLVAVRVARGLMMNPTMRVEQSFQQVHDLLARHNATREEKILAFEAKDGTRRIRGNAHLVIHKADRPSLKEVRDKNFVVAPVPERVDLDFSAHTVLATQQRQKLRLYKGRYGKDLKEAAKDFYREDPATAVVLDTMDEFLLKYLLSVLKQVLGIGKERRYSKAAVQLDLLRHQQDKANSGGAGDDEADEEQEPGEADVASESEEVAPDADDDENDANEGKDDDEEEAEEAEEDAMAALDPQDVDVEGGDALDEFAEAQADEAAPGSPRRGAAKDRSAAALLAKRNLTAAFTREHRPLLESLVPVVLSTLQGEGSDPVVGNALDCLLALVSLRPPLEAVHALDADLLDTVAGFLMRGGAIKQRAMRVCAALICHQKFELAEDQAVRLIALARAEMVERSEFLPMALSLFHAVLRKHVHVVEVYDLIDLVTELLVHLGAKRGIRYRCVQILVRFLTEFKLTPEKFRSHINLFCRNLDYPELAGTQALLELLDALIYRLPTVVLRDEAPVLLPPLTAVVLRGQWRDAREKAGHVIQHLVKLAGVDVLVPLLSGWMDPAKPRTTRQMAAQLWATMIPAVAAAYGLDDPNVANRPEVDEDEDEDAAVRLGEARDGFDQCCAWSLQSVLNGCLYNQYEAAGGKKAASGVALNAKFKTKAEMKGWEHVFYSLRCAEALFTASPSRMYQRLGPAILPVLVDHLILHAHPWVQAVSVRILRHYCYTFVEPRGGYLAADDASLTAAPQGNSDEDGGATAATTTTTTMLFLAVPAAGQPADVAELQTALRDAARALKQCLTRVAMSDVSNELYNAHRAINSPSRAESLKLMVYLLRAVCVLALRLRLAASGIASASARHSVLAAVEKELGLVRRQLESTASPVLRQGRVVNYMVRTATLVQLFGGLTSVLPTAAVAAAASDEDGGEDDADRVALYNDAAQWLLGASGLQVLRLVQDVAAPLVGIALRAANISDRLSTLAHQSASVIAQQLDERRSLLRKRKDTTLTGSKRAREDGEADGDGSAVAVKQRKKEGAVAKTKASASAEMPALDVVLGQLTTHVAAVRQERRVKQITHDTHKSMKRNRREMEKSESF